MTKNVTVLLAILLARQIMRVSVPISLSSLPLLTLCLTLSPHLSQSVPICLCILTKYGDDCNRASAIQHVLSISHHTGHNYRIGLKRMRPLQ